MDKRVVICAAGPSKIADTLDQAQQLASSLTESDLLIVPIVMPDGVAPSEAEAAAVENLPDCVALPVGRGWKEMVNDEAAEAVKQGIDLTSEGICVILKKNGRVGQRTRGIFLDKMVGEVTERRDMGMDIKNI